MAEHSDEEAASPRRLAVLVSGRGSNLQAILDAIADDRLAAEIAGVFSDKPGCAALTRVPAPLRWSRDAKSFPDRAAFDLELGDAVAAVRPDWVVCAGYMRILGDSFVQRFAGRLVNIHPSLLPKHRGLHTHRRALEPGVGPPHPQSAPASCRSARGAGLHRCHQCRRDCPKHEPAGRDDEKAEQSAHIGVLF